MTQEFRCPVCGYSQVLTDDPLEKNTSWQDPLTVCRACGFAFERMDAPPSSLLKLTGWKRNVLAAAYGLFLAGLFAALLIAWGKAGQGPLDGLFWQVRLWEKDGMKQVFVPAGKFRMGRHLTKNDEPIHTVYLDSFWMDRYEVSNAQYARCVAESACVRPVETSTINHASYYENPMFAQYPVVYVSWHDAAAYCAWAGKRLPTEAEWEKAARGVRGLLHPWGEGYPTCRLANYHPCLGAVTAPGNSPAGVSSYGVMDMAGNVAEWVNDRYSASYYSVSPENNPPGSMQGEQRVLRGGHWDSAFWEVQSTRRSGADSTLVWDRIGFRCASSAP